MLSLENLALRQQLAIVSDRKQIRSHRRELEFWVLLFRCWPDCLQTLQVFQPDTLMRCHRNGFRFYWCWRSRCGRGGWRPTIDPEVRQLVRTMSRDNVSWGASGIRFELSMLVINLSRSTVAKYMIRQQKPPSQPWRTFLDNHVADLFTVDSFIVPTATFRISYVFVMHRHYRREAVHFNVIQNLCLAISDTTRLSVPEKDRCSLTAFNTACAEIMTESCAT